MSMNLHLRFVDKNQNSVHEIELVQTPTDITWWCVGYANQDGKTVENFVELSFEETKARYFKWLDSLNWSESWMKDNIDEVLAKYADYTPEFYWM